MDFSQEVLKYQNQMISGLQSWIQIGSVYDAETVSQEHPFGKGPAQALKYIADLARSDGFKVDECDGYCTEITYDVGANEAVMVLGHCDVVPIGEGWKHQPFGGEIENNIIYGRGASDDKGPTLAAYYALKMIKDQGLPLKHNVKIVVGGNEESGSRCLHHYFKVLKRPAPKYGFTPDAEFPLIYGEKGIMDYLYSGQIEDEVIESIHGGIVKNAVPDSATIVFKKVMNLGLDYKKFLQRHNFQGEYANDVNGKSVIKMKGKAAHGAAPYYGINALTILMKFISNQNVSTLCNHFGPKLSCYYGKRLGIDYFGEKMGELTVNVGIGKYEQGKYAFSLNIRYPIDVNPAKIVEKLNSQKMHEGKMLFDSKPLYMDPNSPFIQTLLGIYRDVSGDLTSMPMTIGGGTYARETSNTVAFGMGFPTHHGNGTGNIHTIEEGLNLADYLLGTEIYYRAILALGNME